MRFSHALLCATGVLLAACSTKPLKQSDMHIQQTPDTIARSSGTIPQPSKQAVVLPPPKTAAKVETYSVVVTNLPAREILFALARDAKINIDIHGGIDGVVTLNAINQTLPQILDRISKQVEMRYELKDGLLVVMPDSPFLRSYKIDYVNMARDAEGGISNTSQVGGGGTSGAGSNNSQLAIKNSSKNHFWETLERNIKDILRETDKEVVVSRRASSSEEQAAKEKSDIEKDNTQARKTSEQEYKDYQTLQAASVIASPESGIITVRATGKQHEKIQEFITKVMNNARRQVLIEATIAEVTLGNQYQQGIDWSSLKTGNVGFNLTQEPSGQTGAGVGLVAGNAAKMFLLNYANPTSKLGNLKASVSLLESFGDVKVLSSPKISVMNNQTAMLRVVNNIVYFEIKVTPAKYDANGGVTTPATYSTTPITTPVGFTMSVTPQISTDDTVLINLRPTITRLTGYINDPNPDLANANVTNPVPVTQTREMESMLKIGNNQIAILGGLMQDEISNQSDGVPLISDTPFFGNLFKYKNDKRNKTELVIFLRPVVIKDASMSGDYAEFKSSLPTSDFLKPESEKGTR